AKLQGRRPVVYYTPSQYGLGALRDLVLALACKLVRLPLVGHLHGTRWLHTVEQGGLIAHVMKAALHGTHLTLCLGPTYARKLNEQTGAQTLGINNGIPAPDSS